MSTKSEKKKTLPDFDEEWSQIKNDGTLVIKWYYFPTTTSLKLDIDKIKEVKVRSQEKRYEKNWGSSDLTAWWACDMKRNFRSHPEEFYNVKIDMGDTWQKGFTVKDIHGFLTALRKYLKNQAITFQE